MSGWDTYNLLTVTGFSQFSIKLCGTTFGCVGFFMSLLSSLVKELLDDDPSSKMSSDHPKDKRHINHNNPPAQDDEHEDENDPNHISKVGIRCGHITSPTNLFTTPLMGDFDHDGQLDLTYIVTWSSAYLQAFKTLVVASNLEELFVGAYGKEILDFDSFLPISQQPWTQYMGKNGDSVFTIPPKT